MAFKDLLMLYKKNRQFKQRQIFFLIIMVVILLLSSIIISLNDSIFNYINNLTRNSLDARTLSVFPAPSETDIEKLKENKHILSINKQSVTSFLVHSDKFEDIIIRPANSTMFNNLTNNSLICPKEFVPKYNMSEITKKDIINGKEIIDTNIKISLSKKANDIYNSYEKEFKIVDTYDNYKYMLDNNVCLTSYEDFNDIYNFYYPDSNSETYRLFVDDVKNIDEVSHLLDDFGYVSSPLLEVNYASIIFLLIITIVIFIIFSILIYVLIKFNIKKELNKKEEEILLYKSMGYEKRDIIKIYTIEYLVLCLIALGITYFLSIIILIIINAIKSNYMSFKMFSIKYDFKEIIILFVIGIIYPSIIIKQKIKKIIEKRKIIL